MKIVVTECHHDLFDVELTVARRSRAELVVVHSRNGDEVVANAAGAAAILVQHASITGDVIDAPPGLRDIGRYGTTW